MFVCEDASVVFSASSLENQLVDNFSLNDCGSSKSAGQLPGTWWLTVFPPLSGDVLSMTVSMCADTFNTQSLRQASFLSDMFMIPFTDNTAVGLITRIDFRFCLRY